MYEEMESSSTSKLNSRNTKSSTEISKPPSPTPSDHSKDAGNQSNDHYKARLSPLRYKLRSLLLPLIRKETVILAEMQSLLRCSVLDFYFAWTANLASHTFYVLMLPPPIWFGESYLTRDLVYVLGLGIYFTGFLKDYFCLPRPRSPPLHRITMSSYTTEEYGFPSSHSANATGVSLLLLVKIMSLDYISNTLYYTLIVGLFVYYSSLIFGRLYCGMHGFLDIIVGGSVGLLVFLFRHYLGYHWDEFLFNNGLGLIPSAILIITIFVPLIHIYSEPVDDCPCFDDSVAFVGVLIGLDLAHLVAYHTKYFASMNEFNDPYLIPFDYDAGILRHVLRFLLGVVLVVTWKALSKPVVFTILPPIYKFVGVYLPRRNYISTAHTKASFRNIRSASISNDNGIGDFNAFVKGVTDHTKIDEVGPENDIDYYEMLSYNESQANKKNKSTTKATTNPPALPKFKSQVFRYRYDVEIVGRLIIYAGISITAVWTFSFAKDLVGL